MEGWGTPGWVVGGEKGGGGEAGGEGLMRGGAEG